ncbi:MAG: M20/M25/M40 family metallo-hydrolase [Bacteroidia bacterium]|nr:M20/M25/M40 family metallo-hydrolase [Bacteroidia bacterium]
MKKWFFIVFSLYMINGFAQNNNVQQTVSLISEDSLVNYVKQLTGLHPLADGTYIKSRYMGSAGNSLACTYIKQKLTDWNVAFDTMNFGSTGTNIIAKIPGLRSDKVIVYGAHYDAVGSNNPNLIYPGADDNASGTAAVLEAARACAGKQFPVTLHLIFWDEEEPGLLGSKALVNEYLQGNKLVAYINQDMIAWSPNNDSVVEIHTRPNGYSVQLANKVVDVINKYEVPLIPVVQNPGDPNSDHGSFWAQNLTAVGINEIYNGPKMNPNWHQMSDTFGTFNVNYFYQMAKLGTTVVLDLTYDSLLLGIEDKALQHQLVVTPNPVLHTLNLSGVTTSGILRIYNLQGLKVMQQNYNSNHEVNCNQLQKGMYFIEFINKEGMTFYSKFIKE